MEPPLLGSHVSFTKDGQLLGSVAEALGYGATTFMFYTGAPQNTTRLPIDLELTKLGVELMEKNGINIENVVVHAPYIVNLANDGENYDFAVHFLQEELRRVETLGITKIVLHPGSHVKLGKEKGLENIIRGLNRIIVKDTPVTILLETMAGKGTELGISFEEIKTIIDGLNYPEHIGVCFDTCHLSDAGYDLQNFDELLDQFDQMIGLSKLGCIHINDSKNERSAHKDRHENFGFGTLGFDLLCHIVYHSKLKDIPKILETPYITSSNESKERLYPPYKFEIQMIQKRIFNPHMIEQIRAYYK